MSGKRTNQELARIHLETAIALTNADTVRAWLAPTTPAATGTRGRKPGAAPAETRCDWTLIAGGQCKNAKIAGSDHCKIHVDKAAAITAASATADGSSPS
jgi:hypothetical protein